MKFLFLNNYYYLRGGSERIFFSEMDLLKKHGHKVVAYARKSPLDTPSEYSDFFPKNIETDTLRLTWDAVKTLMEVIYSKTAKYSLQKLLGQINPTIAHAHNIYGRLTSSVLDLLKQKGIPAVMTLHDLKLLCPSYLMLSHGKICEKCKGGNFYKAILNKCHKNSYSASTVYAFETWLNNSLKKYSSVKFFIAPSKFLLRKHIEYGHPPEKFVYLPSFIDVNQLKPFSEIGDYLLYFGRLSREKGVNTLLKAFDGINKATPLLVAGDGPDRDKLEKMEIENTKFTGYLRGKSLFEVISHAKAVVIPSECYENSPLSVLESMAYGKPVIGSRIGGIPELIRDHETGYLFEPGNVEDLRNKIELILEKPLHKVKEMGRAAREKVEMEYNSALHYKRLMEIYKKALL